MIGAWAASKWMIPWADKIGGAAQPGYKALTQGYWALGAVLGSFFGAQLAGYARPAAFLFSDQSRFHGADERPLPVHGPLAVRLSADGVCVQGFIATLFFGWLPLYLPELFPTKVRATGSGIAYNTGRFATAGGVFAAGTLVVWFGGDFAKVGAVMGLIYALGMVAIWWAPETSNKDLPE